MGKVDVGWRPHDGPQTRFLASGVREGLYGGAAGGGKTDALIYGGLQQVHLPGYRALFLRRTFPELREVVDRTHAVFPRLGAKWVASERRWEFGSGATYEFGYCETYKDVLQYQGQEFQYIAVDEVGLWPEERMWTFLLTRNRTSDPRIRRMMRSTANPGGPGHGWLKRRFVSVCSPDGTPYIDKKTGLSRCYVHAKVWDNPTLLEADPEYVLVLESQPDLLRRQLLEGDWDAGSGLAFESVRAEPPFLVPARPVQPWEPMFAAIDWGYTHNFACGFYLVEPDGGVLKVDTVMGRRLVPDQIVERVASRLQELGIDSFGRLLYTVAGSDVKMVDKARGSWGPSVLEQFAGYGWHLIGADQSRVAGYQNLLWYLDVSRGSPPRLRFMDTPGNHRCLELMQSLVADPDSPNDVLKVDTDPMTGEGGDDAYDETRYALMSRPLVHKRLPPDPVRDRVDQARRVFARAESEGRAVVPWAAASPGVVSSASWRRRSSSEVVP